MKIGFTKLTAVSAVIFLMLAFFGFADSVNAQKKEKTTKKQTTQTPQTVQAQTLPVIVSQANQFPEQPQVVTENTQTQPETFDEKLDKINNRLKELNLRMKSLEASKQSEYEQKQKRLLLNLDILTRAEQRAETLRKQYFDLIEKENSIKTKLDTIDYDLRPEMIDRQIAFAGSLRPEELREERRKSLEAEKANLTNLLTEIQTNRANLEQNLQKADQLVEKLRTVFEKDIDNALTDEQKEENTTEQPKEQ